VVPARTYWWKEKKDSIRRIFSRKRDSGKRVKRGPRTFLHLRAVAVEARGDENFLKKSHEWAISLLRFKDDFRYRVKRRKTIAAGKGGPIRVPIPSEALQRGRVGEGGKTCMGRTPPKKKKASGGNDS